MRTEFTHRFVPSPSGFSVTLLTLHGTGGDENDLLPIARSISADAAILSPRGRVLEQGMPRFFRRLAEGVFDQEDLRVRTAELADFIAEAATEYAFDASRVVALGYSNGANIAASLMLTRANVLGRNPASPDGAVRTGKPPGSPRMSRAAFSRASRSPSCRRPPRGWPACWRRAERRSPYRGHDTGHALIRRRLRTRGPGSRLDSPREFVRALLHCAVRAVVEEICVAFVWHFETLPDQTEASSACTASTASDEAVASKPSSGSSFMKDLAHPEQYLLVEYWSEMLVYERHLADFDDEIKSLEEQRRRCLIRVEPVGVFSALDVPERAGPTWSRRSG
jgi:hypothetical protein